MKVSVAMATYNGENYLQEQLNSFLKQTQLPDEVVISDDYSTDKTFEILKNFQKEAPFPVVLLRNTIGQGLNCNFENALTHVTGDIIFISDQDDIWLKNKIEYIVNYFSNNPEQYLVIHDLQFCNSKMETIGQTKIERIKSFRDSLDFYVTGMATAVRKEFLKTCIPMYKGINYDNWLHECANLIDVKGVKKNVLALYRRHEQNATKGELLNVSYKTTRFDFFSRRMAKIFKKTSLEVLDNRKELIEALLTYINKHNNYFKSGEIDNSININFIEKSLIRKKEEIEFRIDLLGKKRLNRIPLATKFLLRGGYAYFAGVRSMIKDLLYN